MTSHMGPQSSLISVSSTLGQTLAYIEKRCRASVPCEVPSFCCYSLRLSI